HRRARAARGGHSRVDGQGLQLPPGSATGLRSAGGSGAQTDLPAFLHGRLPRRRRLLPLLHSHAAAVQTPGRGVGGAGVDALTRRREARRLWRRHTTTLSVDFFAVSDRKDLNSFLVIRDDIHYSVVADANSPKPLPSHELPSLCGPWVPRQTFDLAENPRNKGLSEPFELLPIGAGKADGVATHPQRAFPEPSASARLPRATREARL